MWKNDRAFRSLKHALLAMELFGDRGVTYRSLTELIDTSTPVGRPMFYIINVFAEIERELIGERTRAGLEAPRRSGKSPGRKPKLSPDQIEWAREALKQPDETRASVARRLCVSARTLGRALAAGAPVEPGEAPHVFS